MKQWDIFAQNGDFLMEKPFDFSKHSSIGCGGIAPIGFYPRDEQELCDLICALKDAKQEYLLLGNLSNVLPPDDGMAKAVICTKEMKSFSIEGERVTVSCGVMSGTLLNALKKAGLSGAEFLVGIPCTMGGALYMNGGAGGRYIAELVESVRIYRDGKVISLPVSACGYSYKNSLFMQTNDVILGGVLRLKQSENEAVSAEIDAWKGKRAHLPKGKSMGCVFKNPLGYSAGELIDKAGLKGFRVGGAVVSDKHANFIINDKKATANEIRALIAIVKNAVFAQYKIRLEEEIRYLQ